MGVAGDDTLGLPVYTDPGVGGGAAVLRHVPAGDQVDINEYSSSVADPDNFAPNPA